MNFVLKPEVGAGKLDVLGAWGSPGDGRAGLSTGIWRGWTVGQGCPQGSWVWTVGQVCPQGSGGVDSRAGLSTGILEVDGGARLSTGIWGGWWTVGQGCPQAPLQVM